MSTAQQKIEKYKKDLEMFKSSVLKEMNLTFREINPYVDWVEEEKEKFHKQLENLEDIDQQISDLIGNFNLDILSVRDQSLKQNIIQNYESMRKRYHKFHKRKKLEWNRFESLLDNYKDGWTEPSSCNIDDLSSFHKVEKRFKGFNEQAELITDVQVELENKIKRINFLLSEFKNFIGLFNNLVHRLKKQITNTHMKEIEIPPLEKVSLDPLNRAKLRKVSPDELREQIRKREKIHSRLLGEDSSKLKKLQESAKPASKIKNITKKPLAQKVLKMKDLFKPLNKKRIPVFSKETGKLEGYISSS